MQHTYITAHAGAENTEHNTIESILTLAECGVDYIEVDVQPMDGKLVLSHNDPIPGMIYDTLEDCFREISRYENVKINVDLKREGLIRTVSELAEKYGMNGRYVLTGGIGDAEIPYILENNIDVFYNAEDVTEDKDVIHDIQKKGFEFINIDYLDLNDTLLENAGLFSVWTVDEEADLIRLLKAGVKSITTCVPKLALELRKKIQG